MGSGLTQTWTAGVNCRPVSKSELQGFALDARLAGDADASGAVADITGAMRANVGAYYQVTPVVLLQVKRVCRFLNAHKAFN